MQANKSKFLLKRVFEAVSPDESNIIREILKAGTARKKTPSGGKLIKIYSFNVFDVNEGSLNNCRTVTYLMEENDYKKFNFLAQVLIKNTRLHSGEVLEFIDKYIGWIFLHEVPGSRAGNIRPEQVDIVKFVRS